MNNKKGVFTEPGTVRFERLLPGPAERVWEYLTRSELKAKWLSAGDVETEVGGKVTHEFNHTRLSPEEDPWPEKYKDLKEGDTSHGVVTQCKPPHLLSYTWAEGDGTGSEVTFELFPEGEKVRLVLTHRQLPDEKEVQLGVGAGWHTHLGILIDLMEGNTPQGFWKVHMPLEKEYEKLLS
ncbi:SRPBCC family protein [Gracilimonas sp.]|uniref:SRPBCC family protein n=1 Tax=Gracilimonas sp. TaxID=1974203 RepID=UPI003D136BCF